MSQLKRIEIIANHSVEADIMVALNQNSLVKHYTKIPNVHGRGHTEPKQGNHIWPEENFILIVYTDPSTAQAIESVMENLQQKFPNEGIFCYSMG